MRAALLACTLIACAGCPSKRPAFDPMTGPKIPSTGDPDARARFMELKARFEKDEWETTQREFERIVKEYPDDPIAAHAGLYAGMAAFRRGDWEAAVTNLEPVIKDADAGADVIERASFFLGVSYGYTGKPAAARKLLEPFAQKAVSGDDAGELWGALAEAAAAQGDAQAAIRWWDELWAIGSEAEKVYVAARLAEMVDQLDDAQAREVYGKLDKQRAGAAFLGRKLAASLRAAGKADDARAIENETAQARRNAGIGDARQNVAPANPQRVAALLPLSGKYWRVGEAALLGLAVGAGTFDAAGAQPYGLAVRDAGDGTAGVAATMGELAADGAIAVIGPMRTDAIAEAGRAAETLGMPLVVMDYESGPPASSPHVFGVVVSVERRARALARHAFQKGARDFAVLRPDTSYGQRAADAFADEVKKLGGKVIAAETYKKDATAFADPVKKLAKKPFEALFVPDSAARLELIAPFLAAQNLAVGPWGAKVKKHERAILLLATAEAIEPKFLGQTGRYVTGAVLAPGFYADEDDARIGAYVKRFKAAFGKPPTALDAYAYDAALVVREAIDGGAQDRDSLTAALAGGTTFKGLTGDIRFGVDRDRADDGLLFVVVSSTSIKVQR
jgi:ABC-type branched-subunit amino acid transport system substrate-binding protein